MQTHKLNGTGFVFGDETQVATNYHVIDQELDPTKAQFHIVFSGTGRNPNTHKAEIIAQDRDKDLDILKISEKLKPLKLSSPQCANDGTDVLLTGFPISVVLGLCPATHKGIVAATTPDVIPTSHSSQLFINMLKRLDVTA